MRVARDRLTFLAICALDEAIDQSRAGRLPSTLALRLALAYLYAVGDRRQEGWDREPYDTFWRCATAEDAAGGGADGYSRRTEMRACLNGMARAAGLELDVPMMARVARARGRIQR